MTDILFDVESDSGAWSIMAIGSVLGLSAGAYFTRNYDAEKGYFAEEASRIPAHTGKTKIPNMAISCSNVENRQSPESRLRIPVFKLRF